MWQRLMDWLPDLKVGTFELRDLATLVVGVVGIILAYYAIKLGRHQTAIAAKQDEILQAEIAQKTNVSVWPSYDDVPAGSFALTIWAWSVAPVLISSWKLIIRVEDIIRITVTELATGQVLPVVPYEGPFMPRPGVVVNWQVVGNTPVEIPVGGYKRIAVCTAVRPPGIEEAELRITYELTTKYRKYIGFGKDAVRVKLP